LGAVALCDHNTVAGVPDFLAAAAATSVEAIPGCEFSTDYQGTELHILGLFISPAHYATVTSLLEKAQQEKKESNRNLVQALNQAGYAIDYDRVLARSQGSVNRAHVAAELMEQGYVSSIQEAFQRLLSKKRGFYRPPQWIEAYDCIRFIKSLGAVAVLAHPFLNLDADRLREFLPEAVAAGLDSMEVLYSKYSQETTTQAMQIAEEFSLLPSGGSDYHGQNKPDITMGSGRGNLQIPISWLEALRKRL
jgi:predicted metal-dependent phosphoesterase TrpH